MTDDQRMDRLIDLARQVWPDLLVDVDTATTSPGEAHARRLGAWVQQYFEQPVGPVEGGPVLLSIPEHPRAVDALEAALLVLAGKDEPLSTSQAKDVYSEGLTCAQNLYRARITELEAQLAQAHRTEMNLRRYRAPLRRIAVLEAQTEKLAKNWKQEAAQFRKNRSEGTWSWYDEIADNLERCVTELEKAVKEKP